MLLAAFETSTLLGEMCHLHQLLSVLAAGCAAPVVVHIADEDGNDTDDIGGSGDSEEYGVDTDDDTGGGDEDSDVIDIASAIIDSGDSGESVEIGCTSL